LPGLASAATTGVGAAAARSAERPPDRLEGAKLTGCAGGFGFGDGLGGGLGGGLGALESLSCGLGKPEPNCKVSKSEP